MRMRGIVCGRKMLFMQKMEKSAQKRLLLYSGYIVLTIFLTVLFFRYLFFAVLPFILAAVSAVLLQRPARKISKKCRLSYQFVSVGLTVSVVSVGLLLISFLIWQTIAELGDFAVATLKGENGILDGFTAAYERIGTLFSRLPFFSGEDAEALRARIWETISEMLKNTLVSAASRLPMLAGKVIAAVPQIFVFCAVTVLSAIYFCVDYEKILSFCEASLPKKTLVFLNRFLHLIGRTAIRFAKSYLLIFLFTFSALFLGFTILGESYAFLLALLTAAVDSLPILGMGIVLIPLAIYHFMIADTAYGIGVCAIYLLITLLRQILEPRILGAGMGVHPLLMLMSMYGGLRLFGIFGMLGAPFIVAMLKNLIGVWKKPDEETL